MLSQPTPLRQRFFIEKTPDVSTPASPVLGPVGIPIGAVRALGAARLATSNHLLPETHLWFGSGFHDSAPLQLGLGQYAKTSEVVFVEFLDRVEQIAVERHQATWTGANSLVTVRRSVSVQPWGGVIRSA